MDDLEEMAEHIVLLSEGKVRFDGSFDELRARTGSWRRLVLVTASPEAPKLASASHVSSDGYSHEFEFDAAKTPVAKALAEIAAMPGIVDMEIRKAPIEEVIAGLYRKWAGTR